MAKEMNTIGVLTSGGDAPGMNAAIRAVVRKACANGKKVKGIRRGYQGLLEEDIVDMSRESVSDILDSEGRHDPGHGTLFGVPHGRRAEKRCRYL